ncbi:MAG: hypothetical protein LBH76_05130 [Propionibacteriaceae bacterium]|jgi:alpha-glucuronidase|nr:hypothetical protein [Propionibacteriaceae bacterium]
MSTSDTDDAGQPVDPAWLPEAAWAALGRRRCLLVDRTADDSRPDGDGQPAGIAGGASDDGRWTRPVADADRLLAATAAAELTRATSRHGGRFSRRPADAAGADLVLCLAPPGDPEAFRIGRRNGLTRVTATGGTGLLQGLFAVLRLGERAFGADFPDRLEAPVNRLRMLDHWDNIDIHPEMGQVERGYAGGSLWFDAGRLRWDLGRVRAYARLLAASGVNRVCLNNVNVHATEATLLTERLDWLVRLAAQFRPWGIRTHLAVSFDAPRRLGGLATSDPLDPAVRAWWRSASQRVFEALPDFGGYVVKADSEGQPGPAGAGRTQADGANCLAAAVAPWGGVVHWRAFVYNHRQDWRDRTTDRARAAFDHFQPLDGAFLDNVIIQIKHGPLDFQVREPVSPLLVGLPRTRVALELQATAEYTGQQRHVYYAPEQWAEILGWRPWGDGRPLWQVPAGLGAPAPEPGVRTSEREGVETLGARMSAAPSAADGPGGGLVAVANVGDDPYWTGHPLAQANLYAFGRLAWDPRLTPAALLDEWLSLTLPDADQRVTDTVRSLLTGSRDLYESYTAPLGVCFMVTPHDHYGPSVDGYEYSPWGTYHFADRWGLGVDRSRAAGSGFTAQYPAPWADLYERPETCPDELLLFFHHVPYGHRLHSGQTVVQHIYDRHADGADGAAALGRRWAGLADLVAAGRLDARWHARVAERLAEQARSAAEWRDQIRTYFWRHSGVPDAAGRPIIP